MAYGSLMSTHDLGGAFDTAVIHVTSSVHTITNVYAKKDGIVYTGISTGTNAFDIKVNDKGTYEIWASVDGASASKVDSVVVSQPEEYSVEILIVSSVLNDNSWDVISKISKKGLSAQYWSIGGTKTIHLEGNINERLDLNLDVDAYIIHIDSEKTYLQIGMINNVPVCFYKQGSDFHMAYAPSGTPAANWRNSIMRNETLGNDISYAYSFYNALPVDLKNVLQRVNNYYAYRNSATGGTSGSYSSDYLYLLSEYEVVGYVSLGPALEGQNCVWYDWYRAGNTKAKQAYNSLGVEKSYWTRTLDINKGSFYFVDLNGVSISSSDGRNALYAISPCFCV